ncbi:hypothetical protein K435DRAFT_967159, partial [Dendrothele bispora CBS 962.96]
MPELGVSAFDTTVPRHHQHSRPRPRAVGSGGGGSIIGGSSGFMEGVGGIGRGPSSSLSLNLGFGLGNQLNRKCGRRWGWGGGL